MRIAVRRALKKELLDAEFRLEDMLGRELNSNEERSLFSAFLRRKLGLKAMPDQGLRSRVLRSNARE